MKIYFDIYCIFTVFGAINIAFILVFFFSIMYFFFSGIRAMVFSIRVFKVIISTTTQSNFLKLYVSIHSAIIVEFGYSLQCMLFFQYNQRTVFNFVYLFRFTYLFSYIIFVIIKLNFGAYFS